MLRFYGDAQMGYFNHGLRSDATLAGRCEFLNLKKKKSDLLITPCELLLL